MGKWSRKEIWTRRGRNFCVEISRHEVPARPDSFFGAEGPHRWAVYAYLYPGHPHFAAFDIAGSMFQGATGALPLHAGCTYFRAHMTPPEAVHKLGPVSSFQVGADYNHLHDNHFTQMATLTDAFEVQQDAEELFDWLDERDAKPTPPAEAPP